MRGRARISAYGGGSLRKQRGMALLLVLWGCTLLAILLGGYAMMARTEALQAHYEDNQTRAHYSAPAGLMRAINGLQDPQTTQRWVADGRVYPFAYAGASVAVSIIDESGKIDINSASAPVLEQLFRVGGATAERAHALAQAVMDWRSFGLGSEQQQTQTHAYTAAGLDYGPRHGPFASIEELQLVLGMDPLLYRTLAPVLTIWSGRDSPNPSTAPLLALQAIPGMDPAHAAQLIATRVNGQLGPGLAGGGGVTHSIRSEATLADGTRAVLRATIRLRGVRSGAQPYAVLRWQEGEGE